MYLGSQYIYTRKSKHSTRKTYQAILPVYSTESIFQKPVRSLFLDIRKKKKKVEQLISFHASFPAFPDRIHTPHLGQSQVFSE